MNQSSRMWPQHLHWASGIAAAWMNTIKNASMTPIGQFGS
jgi:hypothetical protein